MNLTITFSLRLSLFFTLVLLLIQGPAFAQPDSIRFTETASFDLNPNPLTFHSSFTTKFDQHSPGFLYAANMERGIGVYDIRQAGLIEEVVRLDTALFNGLDVSNIRQVGSDLFAALGDFQSEDHNTGLAIVDVQNPEMPVVTAVWDTVAFRNGVSHLLVRDGYAYLSIMNDGLLILDVSNRSDIRFVSHLPLDPNFPSPSSGQHHQARGLTFRNDSLWVTFDRGGLRVVDVRDKANPEEVYQYINTDLNTVAAAAYNDVVIKDNYAFISVDYCGLEIIDISRFPYTVVQWYNPWGCNGLNWDKAELHLNELKIVHNEELLFVSGGNTELQVFDISDPESTTLLTSYGRLDDREAAYGMDVIDGKAALAMVKLFFNIPYIGDFGGIRLLEWEALLTSTAPSPAASTLEFYPNPVTDQLSIVGEDMIRAVELHDLTGRRLRHWNKASNRVELDLADLSDGLYVIGISTDQGMIYRRVVKH